jgi:hypothetical protein
MPVLNEIDLQCTDHLLYTNQFVFGTGCVRFRYKIGDNKIVIIKFG